MGFSNPSSRPPPRGQSFGNSVSDKVGPRHPSATVSPVGGVYAPGAPRPGPSSYASKPKNAMKDKWEPVKKAGIDNQPSRARKMLGKGFTNGFGQGEGQLGLTRGQLNRRLLGIMVGIPFMLVSGYTLYVREVFGVEQRRYEWPSRQTMAEIREEEEAKKRAEEERMKQPGAIPHAKFF